MGIFSAITRAVEHAVLKGVQNAFDKMGTAPAEEPEPVVLRLGYRPDEPAAGEEPAKAKGRKVSA
jgi:hypothetical protein